MNLELLYAKYLQAYGSRFGEGLCVHYWDGFFWDPEAQQVYDRLTEAVSQNPRFFLLKLDTNLEATEAILRRTALYVAHREQFSALSNNSEARLKLWRSLLSSS